MLATAILDGLQELRGFVLGSTHPRDPALAEWFGMTAQTAAGISVNEKTAENYVAFYRGIRCISEPLATFPRKVMLRDGDSRKAQPSHPANAILNDSPNPEQLPYHYHNLTIQRAIVWGNGPSEIVRSKSSGRPESLWPIHPQRLEVDRTKAGDIVFLVRKHDPFDDPRPDGGRDVIPAEDMLNVVYNGDGIWGKGIVGYCRESIGLALANDRYAAKFYSNRAKPGGVIQVPTKMSDPAYKRLRESVNEYKSLDRAQDTMILEAGAQWQQVGMPPDVAQFLQTANDVRKVMGLWLGVPPHKLGEQAKYSNIEEQNIEFVQMTLMPWVTSLAQAYKQRLLTPGDERLFVKIVFEKLLQGDITRRTAALKTQFMHGALTINEWLAIEDRDPIGPAGDVRFVPMNLTTIDQVLQGKGDEPPADKLPAIAEPDDAPVPGEPTGGTAPEDQDRNTQTIRTIAETTLRQTMSAMLRKEGGEMAQAAKTADKFLARVESWYARHEQRVAQQLHAVETLLTTVGVEWSAIAFASDHCERAVYDMIEVCGHITAAELVEAVEQHMAERGGEIMEKLNCGTETRNENHQAA